MKHKGFTLIELLVVIAVIGIISSIVISSISQARMKSRDAQRVAQLKQIQNMLELYASDNNGSFPAFAADSRCVAPTPASHCGGNTTWNTLGTALGRTLPLAPYNNGKDGAMCSNCDEYYYNPVGTGYDLMTYLAIASSSLRTGYNIYGEYYMISAR